MSWQSIVQTIDPVANILKKGPQNATEQEGVARLLDPGHWRRRRRLNFRDGWEVRYAVVDTRAPAVRQEDNGLAVPDLRGEPAAEDGLRGPYTRRGKERPRAGSGRITRSLVSAKEAEQRAQLPAAWASYRLRPWFVWYLSATLACRGL